MKLFSDNIETMQGREKTIKTGMWTMGNAEIRGLGKDSN